MTLTAGDIDDLKRVNPHTMKFESNSIDGDLRLTCYRLSDARTEEPTVVAVLRDQLELDQLLELVLAHHRACHEPRGHS